jgi:hypothetical protein
VALAAPSAMGATAVTDVRLASLFRALADELENATARCKAEVESAAFDPDDLVEELSDLVDEIFESEKAPKAGFLIVSVEALEALSVAIHDVSVGDVESAFKDLAWETRKALREFKEALSRDPNSCTRSAGATS